MESADILRFLQEHSDWLSHATFWSNIGQMILFGLLRLFYRVATFAEGLIDAVLLARGFLEHETITRIFEGMLIFSVSLTTLMLMIIAVRKLLNPKVDLKVPLVRGVLTVALIASVPGLLVRGIEVSVNTFEHTRVLGTEEHTSISMAIIRENVADMHFIANHTRGFDILHDVNSTKNNLNEESIWHVDFTEVITPDDIDSGSAMHALRYTTTLDSEGELGVSRIRNRWLDVFDEGYFRWTADWGVLYTTMPLITVFMFCIAFMLLTTLLDLIFLKILVPILAPTDLETGQKMKHIAKDVGGALLSIALIGVSLSIFRILLGFIFGLDINFVARLIYLSAAVTVCMKGSAAFGKYLGVDVGMGSGLKSMLKLTAAGMLATKAAVGGGKLAQKGIRNGIPKAVDGVQKISEGTKNVVGSASESIGQMGAEFAGMGAKDFMKVKAMNAKESLKDGLADANPIKKVKSSFDENIGDKFKEGQALGDVKTFEGLTKLRNQEETDKRMDAARARAKKVKKFNKNEPSDLAKFGESRDSYGSYKTSDAPIDIFKGRDIPLSNGDSIVGDVNFSNNSANSNNSTDTDTEYTLPQFDLNNSQNNSENNLQNATSHSRSNPFDQVKGVAGLNDLKPSKSEKQEIQKMEHSIQKHPKSPSPKTTSISNNNNDFKATKEMPIPNPPNVEETRAKVYDSNVDIPSHQVANTPRITSTNKVPKSANASLKNTPKQTVSNGKKVEDFNEK